MMTMPPRPSARSDVLAAAAPVYGVTGGDGDAWLSGGGEGGAGG
jgi:hypothetical protein